MMHWMKEQLKEFKRNESSLLSLREPCSLTRGDLKSLFAPNKRRPDRSIKRNACRGLTLSSARRRAGASLHVSLWALICLRSRLLSADSHPVKSHMCVLFPFLLSFFQLFILPPLLFTAATPIRHVVSFLADTGVTLLR